jgi:hypothetical protein
MSFNNTNGLSMMFLDFHVFYQHERVVQDVIDERLRFLGSPLKQLFSGLVQVVHARKIAVQVNLFTRAGVNVMIFKKICAETFG